MFAGRGLLFILEFAGLILAYVLYALVFVKFRAPSSTERKKAPRTVLAAVILQSLAYVAAWNLRRSALIPWRTSGSGPAAVLIIASLTLALAAVGLTAWVKKTLGRQWGLAARLVAGHKLVTSGPFRYCRHPLYLGMAGLLLAAIMGLSSLLGAAAAVAIFGLGTTLRIRAEEQLLAKEFGSEFEAYRRRDPAFIPRKATKVSAPQALRGKKV